jgi:hypothetical protein
MMRTELAVRQDALTVLFNIISQLFFHLYLAENGSGDKSD